MQVIEILRSDLGNLNVVDAHLLLLDEIKKQVQRTFVHRDVDFVGGGHGSATGAQRPAPSKFAIRIPHHLPAGTSARFFCHTTTAPRTRSMVTLATPRARFEPE